MSTCIRLELYGCAPHTAIIKYEHRDKEPVDILALSAHTLTFHYTVPSKSKAVVEISTAADNPTLDINIDQVHFEKVTASLTHDNGTTESNKAVATMITNQLKKIDSRASVDFDIDEPNYYSFKIDYNYQVSVQASRHAELFEKKFSRGHCIASANQPQSINQSINQLINQSINQSISIF